MPAANLPDCPRLGVCMTCCRDDIETFSWLNKALIDLFLAAAKDSASSAKNVWRKAAAGNRITKREGTQHTTDHVALVLNTADEFVVAKIDKNILAYLPSIQCPALNPLRRCNA
jgi:hypothetical protein